MKRGGGKGWKLFEIMGGEGSKRKIWFVVEESIRRLKKEVGRKKGV